MSKPIKVMVVVVVAFVKKEKKLDPTSCRPKSVGSCLAKASILCDKYKYMLSNSFSFEQGAVVNLRC